MRIRPRELPAVEALMWEPCGDSCVPMIDTQLGNVKALIRETAAIHRKPARPRWEAGGVALPGRRRGLDVDDRSLARGLQGHSQGRPLHAARSTSAT